MSRSFSKDAMPRIGDRRHPAKAIAGEPCVVSADVFRAGHALLSAGFHWRKHGERKFNVAPLGVLDNDRWGGEFPPTEDTCHEITVGAWTDPHASWIHDLNRRMCAAARVRPSARARHTTFLKQIRSESGARLALAIAHDRQLNVLIAARDDQPDRARREAQFELCLNAVLPDSERYRDAETLQSTQRDSDAPGNITETIARLNARRSEHPALGNCRHNLRRVPADETQRTLAIVRDALPPAVLEVVPPPLTGMACAPRSAAICIELQPKNETA